MATRFWVGGSGNWSSTTKWSTSSGGASGASVPTSVDDAVFDALSGGKFTATVDTAQTVNSLTITPSAAVGVLTISLTARLTTGALTTTSTAGNNRVFFTSTTGGLSNDLVVNGAVSISDCDFRGIYVRGTAAPISGTRIGNRGECRGITFSTPKTVYWNLAAGGNWSANAWALSAGAGVSTNNFPLPQDTATIVNTGLNTSATITLDSANTNLSSIDISGRTTAMTLFSGGGTYTLYGNLTLSTAVTLTLNSSILTFSGGTTQTITSAGRPISAGITVDTYGGTVQLADALNIGINTLTVTNGTFTTAGYAVAVSVLSSNNSNVRAINLGASTVNLSNITTPVNFATSTNLTFNAGTSNINNTVNASGVTTLNLGGQTFYNFTYTNNTTTAFTLTITGTNTFTDNLTFLAPNANTLAVAFSANQTVNGTLTCAGASAVRRIFLRSDTRGTQRDLTVGTLSANDCDFRDIEILGTAAGTAPTRAGDCGGNANITFPAPKTVYWNLAGTQNWNATGWAPGSGGTPAVNNFPLAQDTAVFDNTGSVTGIIINSDWNIGTFDASLRTSAMTLSTDINSPVVYGDWKFGTGVTSSSAAGPIIFSKNGISTITSNGVQFGCPVTINHPSGTVQLADALSLGATRTLTLIAGTFDAVTYNVTIGLFLNNLTTNTLRMGSGTWTLSGTGTVWNCTQLPTLRVGTATIVLSDTSGTSRIFSGGSAYYNKLTIGGATGTSTLTITGSNQFGELASTKTVAHTIAFGSTSQSFNKWTVSGSLGNVVTVTGTATIAVVGAAVTGVNYLALGTTTLFNISPAEFFAGANSTGGTNFTLTAAPAPRTLYWVGGTGNWSSTAQWSTSSGGPSGAAIPTSLDDVVFNSASSGASYTATINPTQARCKSLTVAAPATGVVTIAGTGGLAVHGNVLFPVSGLSYIHSGSWQFAGATNSTIQTNGITVPGSVIITSDGSTWSLLGAFTSGSALSFTSGGFDTAGYAAQFTQLLMNSNFPRSLTLGASTLTVTGASTSAVNFTQDNNFTLSAGSSTINLSGTLAGISGGGFTFGTVRFTSTAAVTIALPGANTFSNLLFTGYTSPGIATATISANQTITGTLTLGGGTASAYRTLITSNVPGLPRTLTVNALAAGAADYDFRDIAIVGAAAPISGTRFGDCGGNSGITFPAAKTVYWAVNTANWGATGAGSWAATSGGAAAADQFPLPQDTAYIPFATPTSGSTITINADYNIGTVELSNRNGSALVTLLISTLPTIYGNWINGTGTTFSGTGILFFYGPGTQTITSAGRSFSQSFSIVRAGTNVVLQDALSMNGTNATITLNSGTFDANGYNVTMSGSSSAVQASSGSDARTLAIGSGTWVVAGTGAAVWNTSSFGATITGAGTISLTGSLAKTFTGGNKTYPTLNQGGAGTLTITGSNTFTNITNSYSATGATAISLGSNTTQTLTSPWTATGAAGRALTISGASASFPATLIYSGVGQAATTVDYLSISNVRAYDVFNEWYAGDNSINNGSLGWYFSIAGGVVYSATITETGTGTDVILGNIRYLGTISELGTGTDSVLAKMQYLGAVSETGTGTDSVLAGLRYLGAITETATGTDAESAKLTARAVIAETATITDSDLARMIARGVLAETATSTDTFSARAILYSRVTEAATGTDLISAIKGYFAAVAESAAAADQTSALRTLSAHVNEIATGQEVINAVARFASRLNETATATDVVASLRVATAIIAESVTGTDVVAAVRQMAARIAEGASITDAVSAVGSVYRTRIAETSSATEIVVSKAALRAVLAETATGTETVRTAFTPIARVAESATITDAAQAIARFAARMAETATITDVVSPAGSVYRATALAAAQIMGAPSPQGIYNAPVLESATVADSIIGAFLWNLIDDAQTSSWALFDTNNAVAVPANWAACAASPSAVVMLNATTPGLYLLITSGQSAVRYLPVLDYYLALEYINGYFYAFSTASENTPLLRSADGITWETVNKAVSGRSVLCVFGNGTQLGIVQYGQVFISTDNGASWTAGDVGFSLSTVYGQAVWDGSQYVMCLASYIYTSSNGLSWTALVFNGGRERGYVVWDGTTYAAMQCSDLGMFFDSVISTSSDGVTWATVPPTTASSTASILNLINNQFILINETGAVLRLDAASQTFVPVGQVPNAVFTRAGFMGLNTAVYKGVVYLPGERPAAYNGTYLTTTDFVTFSSELVNNWLSLDDSQSPGWQNINTLN